MKYISHPIDSRHFDNDSRRTGKATLVWSLALPVLALAVFLMYSAAQPAIQLEELTPISLAGHHKLLVLSPHCDDETLGAGGLIAAAQRVGLDVRVVIMTNGDGYPFATMQEFRRVYPHASDFIQMGNVRQQESLNALQRLGVPGKNVTFLSYPDRGTPELWFDHWLASNPYRSPFTESTRSPYPVTYDPEAVYAGEDLLTDLLEIIGSYQPDLIVYPHPDDVHPDHWGLSAFARLAIAIATRGDPKYEPTQLAYLVHRPDFPEPLGLHMEESLLPPKALSKVSPNWYRLDLQPDEVQVKYDAIREYRTQWPSLRGLMERFARRNELFAQPQPAVLPDIYSGDVGRPDTWQDPAGKAITPVERDPQRDFITRAVASDDDLIAVFAARTGKGDLLLCSQMRGVVNPLLMYSLQVNAVSDSGVVHHGARNLQRLAGWNEPKLRGSYACDEVSLAELGNPWLIFIGAKVEGAGPELLDQIAWQAVYIDQNHRFIK